MPVTARVVRRQKGPKLPKGIIGHSKVKAGFPAGKVDQDILNKAIWTHYGTSQNPESEWPFMSNALQDNSDNYLSIMRQSAPKILSGELPVGGVMLKLGILFQGDIQAEMVAIRDPENAPSTIKKKGSSNPTIDTGETKNNVTFQTYD